MSILPTSISNGLNSVKRDLAAYHDPNNVFCEEKPERTTKIVQASALALAGIVTFALLLKKGAASSSGITVDFKDFVKNARFKDRVAYYKGKPLTARVSKKAHGIGILELRYENGLLRSASSVDVNNTSSLVHKRYYYDEFGNMVRFTKKDKKANYEIFLANKKNIIKTKDGELWQVVKRLENGRTEITDYGKNPNGIVRTI